MTAGSTAMSRTGNTTRVLRLRPPRPTRRRRLRFAAASAVNRSTVTMSDLRTGCVPRPVRAFFTLGGVAAALTAAAAPLVFAAPANAAVAVPSAQGQGITDFYAARGGAPLWFEFG